MESSSEFSERSGSSLSWTDCNDAPAERNEDWDFVLPRSKTHVAPHFSASEEEDQSSAQDYEEEYQLIQGHEEDQSPAQDRQEDYQFVRGQEEDHQPAQCQEKDQQPAQDHEEAPRTDASPESNNIEAEAEDQTQTAGAECGFGCLDCSTTSATDQTALNESYFTKAEAFKSLRAEFNATNKFEPTQLADAEGWLDFLYETLAPSFPPKETELDKDMRQLSVAIFLERQLKLRFLSGDSLTLKAIAYRHMLRPSNARVAKLLYELSKRAKFADEPSSDYLKWQISGLQQENKMFQGTVTYVEQMNQQFVEDNNGLKKKNLELEKKNGELANKNYRLEKKNDELEKVKRKVEMFEDRLDVERAVKGTFNEGFNAALAQALGAFSKVLDEKLDEKTDTPCKCPQDSAPKAAPSTTQVEATRKPALQSSTTRAAERAAAIRERHDRAARRVTAMRSESTKAIDSARIKAQKNSGDRGAWLQSGFS